MSKLIIDTDPGIDDVFAILLALSHPETTVELISLTVGNIDTQNSLRNAITCVQLCSEYLKSQGRKFTPPRVAVGCKTPLSGKEPVFDYFHGIDGLGNSHAKAPHFTPDTALYKPHFESDTTASPDRPTNFIPDHRHSADVMLEILKQNPEDSVTIVALGPATTVMHAAAKDYETFSRAREIVAMAGNIREPGNVTPFAEFNVFADATAAAALCALTSPDPSVLLPRSLSEEFYDALVSARLHISKRPRVVLVPLDATHRHCLSESQILKYKDTKLGEWLLVALEGVFQRLKDEYPDLSDSILQCHDPLAVAYAIFHRETPGWFTYTADLRIEDAGRWTRGMCVIDKRGRSLEESEPKYDSDNLHLSWLNPKVHSYVEVLDKSPYQDEIGKSDNGKFAEHMLNVVFGN
ncbi:hypothetical protein CANCADRAFT_31977 [Tortispora caseinolytica NRRL Y-17796]|uniref:Inosine/uridine-preferring nucleoside hydrolase domain-containing protein n=1 Tax=Tortispora caseinolytica NRRL Y-17796 TaxID=767744 RepID=A0A1E4THV1_9ASCO|nr:hypothetical protein CANCADRAFT_31977 [Tortispora caseinolytica NRRL Y-17796]